MQLTRTAKDSLGDALAFVGKNGIFHLESNCIHLHGDLGADNSNRVLENPAAVELWSEEEGVTEV